MTDPKIASKLSFGPLWEMMDPEFVPESSFCLVQSFFSSLIFLPFTFFDFTQDTFKPEEVQEVLQMLKNFKISRTDAPVGTSKD